MGAFANGGNFIFSGGNFINIRVNQSKIVGKLKKIMGENVLVEFENVFLIGGIFFLKVWAKNNFEIEKTTYFGNYTDPC